MSTLQLFGIISALLNLAALFPYIYDIVKGKTKPERASWLIWTSLGLIAFFSQLAKGATNSLWMVGASVVGAITITSLSIKRGGSSFSKLDKASLVTAFVGIILWFLTREAAIALFITIFVNAIGSFLTTVKAYRKPESETLLTWILATAGGLFCIFSVGQPNFILLVYPVYVFIANLLVALAIIIGKNTHKTV